MKARNYSHSNVAVRYVENIYLYNHQPKRFYISYQKQLYHFFTNAHPNVQNFVYQLILLKAKEMNLSRRFVPRKFKDYLLQVAQLGHRIQQKRKQWIRDEIIATSSPLKILEHLFVADYVNLSTTFFDIDMLQDETYFDFIIGVGKGGKIWKWLKKLPFELNQEEFYFFSRYKHQSPETMWKAVYRGTLSTIVDDVSEYEWLLFHLEKMHISKTKYRLQVLECCISNFDKCDKRFMIFVNNLKWFFEAYPLDWQWRLNELDLRETEEKGIYPALVNNLFAKYPVHPNACKIFNLKNRSGFNAFLHLAFGFGIRSLTTLPFKLSKGEAQHFLDYPNADLYEAHYFSKARVAGATVQQAVFIARSIRKNHSSDAGHLQKIIYFLARQFPNGHYLIMGIIRYILLQLSKDENFKLKGRTAKSIERDTVAFYSQWLRRTNRAVNVQNLHYVMQSTPYHILLEELKVWLKRPMPNFHFEKGNTRYEIRQINSYLELRTEGRVMHHCVLTYANSCRTGHCSIWSFSKYNSENRRRRILTIEVRGKAIVQAKGTYNRTRVNAQDYEVLYQWTKQENLELNTEKLYLKVS